MKTALSIAGSDSSGGAGIQADLKTMTMNGVYAMSAITALTAQNTTGVSAILDVTPHFLQQQIDAVFTDIPPDAVKIGMVSSAPLIQTIARCLRTYQAANIVVDPVMVATSGARLLDEDAVETLTQTLLPLADLLTPNLPEAEVLSGCSIQTEADMVTAARRISQTYHCAVLCKGGHSVNDANDLLYADGTLQWFRGRRIANSNTHGTGCTLSSAIAANLAKGFSLPQAVQRAKDYVSQALAALLQDGRVRRMLRDGLPYPYTEADARAFLAETLASDPEEVFAFAIAQEDIPVGSLGMFRQGNIHRRTAELGYYLGPDHWGQGIGTWAVREAVQWAFARTDLLRIFAEPFAENHASCRVLEKAGFQLEGVLRQNAVKDGRVLDMKMYARCRGENDPQPVL